MDDCIQQGNGNIVPTYQTVRKPQPRILRKLLLYYLQQLAVIGIVDTTRDFAKSIAAAAIFRLSQTLILTPVIFLQGFHTYHIHDATYTAH